MTAASSGNHNGSLRTQPDDCGAVDASAFRRTLGHYCSGLIVVAAVADGAPVGMTCQSFFSVSLEPPLVALSVGKSSTSFPTIRQAQTFSISVLAAHQREVSATFARTGADKWRGIDWRPGCHKQPILHGAIAWFECRIRDIHDAGDHEIVVADVLDFACDETAEPLLFFRGEYLELFDAEVPGAATRWESSHDGNRRDDGERLRLTDGLSRQAANK